MQNIIRNYQKNSNILNIAVFLQKKIENSNSSTLIYYRKLKILNIYKKIKIFDYFKLIRLKY